MILLIYLSEKFKNSINIIAKTTSREIYLIDKLKIKMLIEINIIKSKEIDILISRSSASIFNYKIEVSVKLKFKGRAMRQSIHARKAIDMLPHSQIFILIHFIEFLSNSRDFLFESKEESYLSLYTHLVDNFLSAVLARNNSNIAIKISRNYRMRIIAKTNFDFYYHVSSKDVADLIAR